MIALLMCTSAGSGSGNSSPAKPKATPVKKATTRGKKTPNSNKKQQDSSDVSDNDGNEATPATARSKRSGTKRNYAQLNGEDSASNGGSGDDSNDDVYAEEGETGTKKKAKIEVSGITVHGRSPFHR